MRYFVTRILVLLSLIVAAQPIPIDPESGKFKYEKVILEDSLKKEVIYKRAKNWILRTFKSGDNVMNFDDDEKESIIANGNILLEDQGKKYTNVILNFKFSVYCKDHRYKVIIDNFMLGYTVHGYAAVGSRVNSLEEGYKKEGMVGPGDATEKTQAEVAEKLKKLVSDIENAVYFGGESAKKNDW